MQNGTKDTSMVGRFDTISPLDYRYYGDNPVFFKRLQPYVSEAANIKYLLRVELSLVRALAHFGICPPSVPLEVEKACSEITASEVYAEENIVHHNIRAIVNCIRRKISEESRPYIHLFATSNDIMDTAYAIRYKEFARDVLLPDLIELERVLINLAKDNKRQIQIGRTHGQHAVPTTFGYAISWFVSRIGSRIEAIDMAHGNLRGKLSGAVGAFNALSLQDKASPTDFEAWVLNDLGLKSSPTSVSTQLVEPEFLTDFVYSITSCFSVLANLADDIRNLVRTEIAELIDVYEDRHVGSSTMPHKMNPKNFENVKSLWKEFMPRMTTVFMDQISEHQRDLTNSASLRFLPELFTGFCYAVERMKGGLKKIKVHTDKMMANFETTKDKIVAEPLYIILALNGYPDAYDITMRLSREAQAENSRIMDLALQHPELHPLFEAMSPAHRSILENPALYIGDAVGRTDATCEYWSRVTSKLNKKLKDEQVEADQKEPHRPILALG